MGQVAGHGILAGQKEFIAADQDGLGDIEGAKVGGGRDGHHTVAVAQVGVGQARIFGAEHQRAAVQVQSRYQLSRQTAWRLPALTVQARAAGGADDPLAIGAGLAQRRIDTQPVQYARAWTAMVSAS